MTLQDLIVVVVPVISVLIAYFSYNLQKTKIERFEVNCIATLETKVKNLEVLFFNIQNEFKNLSDKVNNLSERLSRLEGKLNSK